MQGNSNGTQLVSVKILCKREAMQMLLAIAIAIGMIVFVIVMLFHGSVRVYDSLIEISGLGLAATVAFAPWTSLAICTIF